MSTFKQFLFLLVTFSMSVAWSQVSPDYFENPPQVPKEVWSLMHNEVLTKEQDMLARLTTESQRLRASALLPDGATLRAAAQDLYWDGVSRLYGWTVTQPTEGSFELSLFGESQPDVDTVDGIFQDVLLKLLGQPGKEQAFQEIDESYREFLETYTLWQEKAHTLINDYETGLEQLIGSANGASQEVKQSTLMAVQDALWAPESIEERLVLLEEPDSKYADLVNKSKYRELLRKQQEYQRHLRNTQQIDSALSAAVVLAERFDAIEDYQASATRNHMERSLMILDVAGQVVEKNPFDAFNRLGQLGLSFYDDLHGGPPEVQRHNELRKRLAILVDGQVEILKELADVKALIEQLFAEIQKNLDGIRYIVTGNQRLIAEQGLKGLRECEQFIDAKKFYVFQDSSGPRLDLGYTSYQAMNNHFSQRDQNQNFHSCLDFLLDATFLPEGLSLLKVAEDQEQAELISAEIGQSVAWISEQLAAVDRGSQIQLDFLVQTLSPEYLLRFLGAFTTPSLDVKSLNQKLKLVSAEGSEPWEDLAQQLDLARNIDQFFNPYTLSRIARAVDEVQPLRLIAGNQKNELLPMSTIQQPGFSPLSSFLGSSVSQQFDHYSELTIKTHRLLQSGIAQQGFYSGDLLIPLLAVIGMSPSFEEWARDNNLALLSLIRRAREAYKTTATVRQNVLLYKLSMFWSAHPYADIKEFLEDHQKLENESDEEWEERVIAILIDLSVRPYRNYGEVIGDVAELLRPEFKSALLAYQQFFLDRYTSLDPGVLFQQQFKGADLYKKHLSIDIYTGRPSHEPINDDFFRRRWADPFEVRNLFWLDYDVDRIDLATDVREVDAESKTNAFYEQLDSREGSLLKLPLQVNVADKIAEEESRMTHFPGVSRIQSGTLWVTSYTEDLAQEAKKIESRYLRDYKYLWQSPKHEILRRQQAITAF